MSKVRQPTLLSQVKWGLGGLGCLSVFTLFAVLILSPILIFTGEAPEEVRACQSNLERLQIAAIAYSEANEGRLPLANWEESLRAFEPDPTVYACPRQNRVDPMTSGYAMNQAVLGKPVETLAPETILFFDSDKIEPSAVDREDRAPIPGRHRSGRFNNVVYVNGQTASRLAR